MTALPAADELVARVRAAIDEVEWWAREASRPRYGYTESGEHWRWEGETTDQPVTIGPVLGEIVEGESHEPIGLRSVEQYPARSFAGTLVHLVIRGQEELEPAVAGHIVRHDPATVLRRCAADRKTLDLCVEWIQAGQPPPRATWSDDAAGGVVAGQVLQHLAEAYGVTQVASPS